MHILVIDGNYVETELRAKFGPGHKYSFISFDVLPLTPGDQSFDERREAVWEALHLAAKTADVIFCFQENGFTDWNVSVGAGIPMFVEVSSARSLGALHSQYDNYATFYSQDIKLLFGFCGLPTLLNRPLLEVSLYDEADRAKLAATCAALGTDYRVVADRVGLVTPRVVCQIINEACFTVQEGTASMADVDLAMQLGTNYPRGPFAWANAIGVERVYAVLEALWNDTHDERYKVCPLLKRQALRGEPFAV